VQINAAWEVLGNTAKRSEYDRNRTQQKASSSDSRPKPQPRSTPHSNTIAQEEAHAEAEDNEKREQWEKFEKAQEKRVRRCESILKPLQEEIDQLNAKIEENRAKLANDIPYAWNVFASLKNRLTDEEKHEIRLASADAEKTIRTKMVLVQKTRVDLNQLLIETARRLARENKRIDAHEAKMERLAKERAEYTQR
jgi:curved DNA-binding protein CbpA